MDAEVKELNLTASSNRFKFLPFRERIKHIHIDLISRNVNKLLPEPEQLSSSYFSEGLEKWRELNCTSQFKAFVKQVQPLSRTLAQLFHHRDEIVTLLDHYLQAENAISLEPLLELISMMAKDLQGDFFPSFPTLFHAVLRLMESKDLHLLEHAFACIAHLFKAMSKELIADINNTIDIMAPLLRNQRAFIRRFAAESFGFLLRKLPDLSNAIGYIIKKMNVEEFESSEEETAWSDGVALLFFEVVKQVDGNLHSRSSPTLSALVQETFDLEDPNSVCFKMLEKLFSLIVDHAAADKMDGVWSLTCGFTSRLGSEVQSISIAERDQLLNKLGMSLSLLVILTSYKNGADIGPAKPLLFELSNGLLPLLTLQPVHTFFSQRALALMTSLFAAAQLEEVFLGSGKDCLESIFLSNNPAFVMAFALSLKQARWTHFPKIIIPKILSFIVECEDVSQWLLFFSRVFEDAEEARLIIREVPHHIKSTDGRLRLPPSDKKDFGTLLLDLIQSPVDWIAETGMLVKSDISSSAFGTVAAACHCVSIFAVERTGVVKALYKLLESLRLSAEAAQKVPVESFHVGNVTGDTVNAMFTLCTIALSCLLQRITPNDDTAEATTLWSDILQPLLQSGHAHERLLRTIANYFERCPVLAKVASLEGVYVILKANIGHLDRRIRESTYRILAAFEPLPFKESPESPMTGPCSIFQYASRMESIPATVDRIRERSIEIRRIEAIAVASNIPTFYKGVASSILISQYSVPFSPLWDEVTKSLVNVAKAEKTEFWKGLESKLTALNTTSDEFFVSQGLSIEKIQDAHSDSPDDRRLYGKKFSFESRFAKSLTDMTNQAWQTFEDKHGPLLKFFVLQGSSEAIKLDAANTYILLLRMLSNLPHVVEEKSRVISPLFLDLYRNRGALEEGKSDNGAQSIRSKVLEFLRLFSKLKNPANLYRAQDMFDLLMSLLMNGEAKMQQLALDTLLTWKQPGVVELSETLHNLTDEDKFRDALSTIDVDQIRATLSSEHISQFMQVLTRILFGKMIARKGKSSSKAGVMARRSAIFVFLTRLDDVERSIMLELMSKPFDALLSAVGESGFVTESAPQYFNLLCSAKQQMGFLTLLEDMIKQFQILIASSVPRLMTILLYVLANAESVITAESNGDDEDVTNDTLQNMTITQLKAVRQAVIKRFVQLFSIELEVSFTAYVPQIFDIFIRARVPRFAIENTQAPSGLLELCMAWARREEYAFYLVDYDKLLFPSILDILSAKKVNENVSTAVIGTLESLLNLQEENTEVIDSRNVIDSILCPYIPSLLRNLDHIISRCESESSLRLNGRDNNTCRIISILSRISPFVKEGQECETLVDILVPYLKKADKLVPEAVKVEILSILKNFLPLLPKMREMDPCDTGYFVTICQMFTTLPSREARSKLLEVFAEMAKLAPTLQVVQGHVEDLNAWSTKRIDEPDFDRRFNAFTAFNQQLHRSLTCRQWLPVLQNFIYYVQEEEEFSVRTSASFGVTQFILRAASEISQSDIPNPFVNAGINTYGGLISHVLIPAIKKGLTRNVFSVRQEFIHLLGQLVKAFPQNPMLSDLEPLLGGDDEECNFFLNIHHLQVHRRVKAMRKLAELCDQGTLSSSNLSTLLLPLVIHFIFEADRVSEHNLVNEAVNCVGQCCKALSWGHFYAVFRRILNAVPKRPAMEKTLIRLLAQILDKFHFETELPAAVTDVDDVIKAANEASPFEEDDEDTAMDDEGGLEPIKVIQNVVDPARVHKIVIDKMLPELNKYLATKNDETVPTRIPIALAICKLLKHLPEASMHKQLPKLLGTLCNLMSSHLQDARDSTRETLVQISLLLGPKYLQFIISELCRALTRGYQLHVLGYTVHSILSALVPTVQPGDIDDCVSSIVPVCVEDLFGTAGQEKEVEELRGKMREIKTSKAYDSFELMAKVISLGMIDTLLLPLKELMLETSVSKVIRKIDEVFRRMALGLNSNQGVEVKPFMIFVQKLVTENLPLAQEKETEKAALSNAEKTFRVQMKRNEATDPLRYYQANAHMFIEFGLSLLLTALKREKISLQSKEHLQMLDPLVPVLGRSLYAKQSQTSILAIRAFCVIAKAPLPQLRSTFPVVVKRLFGIIARTSSIESELIQVTFRLLTITLRDCKDIEVTQSQLVALIALIKPDLELPDLHTTTFAMIKAILTRKFVVKEVYDLMDIVSKIMITSQSDNVRELCRQCYIQFLLDYPHGSARVKDQVGLLVKNLSYEFESGRESVLEVIHVLIEKFTDALMAEYYELFFLSLVMNMVNDESAACREMTAVVLKKLLLRLDSGRVDKLVHLVNKWFGAFEQPQLQRMAAQVYGLLIESFNAGSRKWLPSLLPLIQGALDSVIAQAEELVLENEDDSCDSSQVTLWELGYYTLLVLSKAFTEFREQLYGASDLWLSVRTLLLHPHQWIRSVACRLIASLLSSIDCQTRTYAVAAAGSNKNAPSSPHLLLQDTGSVRALAHRTYSQLKTDAISIEHAKLIVKNLFFIGKVLYYMGKDVTNGESDDDPDAEEEEVEDDEEEKKLDAGNSTAGDSPVHPLNVCSSMPLLKLCRKISFLARADAGKRRGSVLRKSVFQWFAAMAAFIPNEELGGYLHPMISTLYRTAKDETAKGNDADELKRLANEVMDILQKQAGTNVYVEVYNQVHFHVLKVRDDRRIQRARLAIVDPQARAKRREQKNEMKKGNRKRRAQDFSKKRISMNVSAKRAKH